MEDAYPARRGAPDLLDTFRFVRPDTTDIERRLAAYLDTQVSYFHLLASGWETMVFEFSLPVHSPRVRELPAGQALVLRFYQGSHAIEKGTREAAIIHSLAEVNYPV